MPLNNFHVVGFEIPRYSDRSLIDRFRKVAAEAGLKIKAAKYGYIFSGGEIDAGDSLTNQQVEGLLVDGTIAIRTLKVTFDQNLVLGIDRPVNSNDLTGSLDKLRVEPEHKETASAEGLVRLIAFARKHFEPIDAKPFLDYLEKPAQEIYRAREANLQKLEELQQNFFKEMLGFTTRQQGQQEDFERKLTKTYADRAGELEKQHGERIAALEAKEAELKAIRDAIDERENRQARRDIYGDLKKKLEGRNQKFELTWGAKLRRYPTHAFVILLLLLFGVIFVYCFKQNVLEPAEKINWVAVGSQVGSFIAFVAVATFYVRWNNQWSQKHADEEFGLKRLDLDIDRANWLVELALEWDNITGGPIPPELVDKLSRSLFVTSEAGELLDIHPAETVASGLFGKDGRLKVTPTGFLIERSERPTRKRPKPIPDKPTP